MFYLKKLFALGKLEYKTSLVYRMRFMSSIVISPLMLMMVFFLWQAVYSNNAGEVILGYSFTEMMTYYVISMIIGHFIFTTVGDKMQQKVLYGELTHDLLKPVPVFQQFLSRELADRSFAFFVEVIPVFIISMIAFRVRIYSIMNLGLFLAGLLMSFMINFLLGYLAGMLAFWIKNIESIQWLMFFIVRFMSGEFVPLDFMGSTMMAASRFLPFYYLRYGLIQVFIGRVSFAESVFFLAGQLAWVLLLYLCVRLVWGIALKKFGAEGG